MLIVTYHQNRMTRFHIGAYRTEGTAESKITHPPKDVQIFPGTNYITDPADVKGLKENKQFQESAAATKAQKEAGKPLMGIEFEEFEDGKAPAKGAKPVPGEDAVVVNPYEKVPAAKMLDTIAKSINIKELEEMAKVETRANVSTAISKRITKLRKEAKNGREGSEEEG